MSLARIPQQQARDQRAVADYLRDVAAKIDRAECDPYGVVVVLVGPEQEDVGSRGLVYAHDYRRASRALSRTVTDAIARHVRGDDRLLARLAESQPSRVSPDDPENPPPWWRPQP